MDEMIHRHYLEADIRERRRVERLYRTNAWADWPQPRLDNVAALRALLALRSEIKRALRVAEEHKEREARRLAESWGWEIQHEDAAA